MIFNLGNGRLYLNFSAGVAPRQVQRSLKIQHFPLSVDNDTFHFNSILIEISQRFNITFFLLCILPFLLLSSMMRHLCMIISILISSDCCVTTQDIFGGHAKIVFVTLWTRCTTASRIARFSKLSIIGFFFFNSVLPNLSLFDSFFFYQIPGKKFFTLIAWDFKKSWEQLIIKIIIRLQFWEWEYSPHFPPLPFRL